MNHTRQKAHRRRELPPADLDHQPCAGIDGAIKEQPDAAGGNIPDTAPGPRRGLAQRARRILLGFVANGSTPLDFQYWCFLLHCWSLLSVRYGLLAGKHDFAASSGPNAVGQ